jgi:prepilin peptidase CpaA
MLGAIEGFPITIPAIAVVFLAIAASFTDVARGRIFNWLTIPMALSALVFAFATQGFSGLAHALLGMGLGLVLYGCLFFFRMLGGGDVKLLMAFGAWGGIQFVEQVAVMGIILGGVMALAMIAFKAKSAENMGKKHSGKQMMPFGVPISIAAVWVQFGHPVEYLAEHWGLHL